MVTRQSGFYTVWLTSGSLVEAVLRGKVRKAGPVLTGDRVRVRVGADGSAVVEEVLPRTTWLARPPVANVSCLVAVAAAPEPDLFLLDRLLVLGEASRLACVVCINKIDLATPEQVAQWRRLYEQAGYPVAATSGRTGDGVADLARLLVSHVSTLSGPSGVGKSSLINALYPEARLEVGELSPKLGRGRHTTRQVQLLPLPAGGLLADTPGFSRLELEGIAPQQLDRLMPDIRRAAESCEFGDSCMHRGEEGCALPQAVEEGAVAASRFRHYRRLLEEVLEQEARKYS